MKKEITFLVQGSAAEPYEVRFVNRGNGNLSAYCNCIAGQNGLYCKHRFGILRGDQKGVVKGKKYIPTIQEWATGSDIEKAIILSDKAEIKMKAADKTYKNALKDFEHNHEALLEKDTSNRRTMIENSRIQIINSLDEKAKTKALHNHSKKNIARSMMD